MKTFLAKGALVVVLITGISRLATAQETIFNVPSPDVLSAKSVYIETDNYFRSWDTDSGHTAFTYLRGVVGVGKNIEAGINAGAADLRHASNSTPFIDATIKWRPILKEIASTAKTPGNIGFYIGDNAGVCFYGDTEGRARSLTYAAGTLKLPNLQTRFAAGPYFATKYEFGERRFGALLTAEQPLPWIPGLEIAGDWFTGDGGYFTPGFIYNRWGFTFYVGYGLANTGRTDDLMTLELGYTF